MVIREVVPLRFISLKMSDCDNDDECTHGNDDDDGDENDSEASMNMRRMISLIRGAST